jgi:dTDP-4-amino-4,6-dideoxygalactose transaminase
MNQLAAAVALAQLERNEYFINLRRLMGEAYKIALKNSKLLTPQYEPEGYFYSYYTFSAKFNGDQYGVTWYDFRKKYLENGGDGIYAASKLQHQEPAFRDNKIGYGETPVAIDLQKKLMNFTTNQANENERMLQIEALTKTLKYFNQ